MHHPVAPASNPLRDTLRVMAAYEALKGLAALAALAGLLSLLHHDLHQLALELIGRLHLKPTAHTSEWLLEAADTLNTKSMTTVAAVVVAYALLRWTEAWGLWHDKAWGEWLGVASTALYVPFELRHLMHHAGWQTVLVLVLNLALVAVLALRLVQRHQQARAQRRAGGVSQT